MQTDEAIKYNALYQEVELAISNIKNLGFDVIEIEKKLKDIHNEVNNNVKVNYVRGMAEASYIQSYSTGISELNKLKIKLDNYNVYAVAYNTCNYINNKIDGNLSIDELNRIVSKIIFVLKSINKSGTIDYDNEKHIVEKIYETAYNIIKLEILMTGESQLYLFVRNEEANISYFNNLIVKDIEKIDLRLEENKKIETKVFELGQNGIYSNYLDLDLIKLILLTDDTYNLRETIIKNIKNIGLKILDSTKKIIVSEDNLNEQITKRNDLKSTIKDGINDIKKRIVSLALSITLIATGSFGIVKMAGKAENNSDYDRKVEIYSTETGNSSYKEGRVLDKNANPSDSVVARIYDNSDNSYHYEEYDISDQEFEDIRDYYDYVRDNYDTKGKTVEVERDTYARHNMRADVIVVFHLIYLILLMLLDMATWSKFPGDFDFIHYVRIGKIRKLLDEVRDEKAELADCQGELEELVNDVMNEINKNEELRKRFNELYQENAYLLDDPEELYGRINNLMDIKRVEKVKKLVKERNN